MGDETMVRQLMPTKRAIRANFPVGLERVPFIWKCGGAVSDMTGLSCALWTQLPL